MSKDRPTHPESAITKVADDPDATQTAGTATTPASGRPAAGSSPSFGRFHLVRLLGGGGMGQVFEVFDPDSNQSLALKTWLKEDRRLRASLASEFRALANLRHPNLIRLYELSLSEWAPYFTMELVQGHNLLEWIRPKAGCGAAGFDEARLRDALRQLAAGLNFLHGHGLLHRDIKPSNIMVTSSGELKLLDFGVAVSLGREGIYEPTITGATAGTDKYMSPLQAAGGNLSSADDWYSVGLVLFECLTGQFPFPLGNSLLLHEAKKNAPLGVSPQVRQPEVPDDLDQLCCDLLIVDSARRPTGAADPVALEWPGRRAAHAPPVTRVRLLGRAAELELLRQTLAGVLQSHQPRIVLIHGNSGVGKSELIGRFLEEEAERGDVRVFRGRCYESVFAPYQAFEELLTDVCRHLRKLSDLERQAALPGDIRSLRNVFPVFDDYGVLPAARDAGPNCTPQERRQQGFAALRELLLRLGPASTLQGRLPLLFVDDLQWGDLDSLALLVELMRAPAAPPCLFVGSFRNEDAPTSPFLLALRGSAVQQLMWPTPPQFVEMRPLSQQDAAELAAELLAAEPAVTAELTSLIARQSQGNPLFVYELARYWQTRRRCPSDRRAESGFAAATARGRSAGGSAPPRPARRPCRPARSRARAVPCGGAGFPEFRLDSGSAGRPIPAERRFGGSTAAGHLPRPGAGGGPGRTQPTAPPRAARAVGGGAFPGAATPASAPVPLPPPSSTAPAAAGPPSSLSTEHEFLAQQLLGDRAARRSCRAIAPRG